VKKLLALLPVVALVGLIAGCPPPSTPQGGSPKGGRTIGPMGGSAGHEGMPPVSTKESPKEPVVPGVTIKETHKETPVTPPGGATKETKKEEGATKESKKDDKK
jgi:hypothetical protein